MSTPAANLTFHVPLIIAGFAILVLYVPESPPDASAGGTTIARVSIGTMTAIRRLNIGLYLSGGPADDVAGNVRRQVGRVVGRAGDPASSE